MSERGVGDPRRVAALLANPDMRRAWAQVVLGHSDVGEQLNPARRKKVIAALESAGLVTRDENDRLSDSDGPFLHILAMQPAPVVARGIERFVRDGRITGYPSNSAERAELLGWVASQVLAADEVLDEKQLNERLVPFSEDFAGLRRYLVDHELVERTPSGTAYALVAVARPNTSP